uniref:Uncharacterized protein n=1 Tax=Myoviridae sp. ct4uh47 TaxID=2825032 RepID=A0A8S5V608_9CAUD|nr:MAG TPA: hypothetical protein [Myoviridae sp. ct4uh47]
MALIKVPYVDNQTVIAAEQLNAIQDEIIRVAAKVDDGGLVGPPGPAGIVISSTQPTGDTHPVWLDPDGGASIENPLNLTGATVGQIAKISAVDDNGVPTAWEPMDMASVDKAEIVADVLAALPTWEGGDY